MTASAAPALRGLLDEGGGHGVVFRGVGPRHEDEIRLERIREGIAHRARADGLEQGGHRARVAKPRAVVHVVRAEGGADELLEEVVVLVRAFRRAEAGQTRGAVGLVDFLKGIRRQVQGFLPARLAEQGEGVSRKLLGLGRAFLADEGGREPVGVMGVVEPVAALHAEPSLVHRTRLIPPDAQEGVARHLVGDGTPHAAVGADRIHLLGPGGDDLQREGFVRERIRGAGGHALPAGDAGGLSHGKVRVEHDAGARAPAAASDDVVALDVRTGADAAVAQDARAVVDGDDGG